MAPTDAPQRNLNISNSLSALRMVLAVPGAWAVLDHRGTLAIAISITGMITDVLDGYFARKLNEVTELGKVIDPIADKVYILSVSAALLVTGLIPPWFAAVVFGRDMIILIGGVIIKRSRGIVLMSNAMGKATVVVLAIFLLLIVGTDVWPSGGPIFWLMELVIVMMAASLGVYAVRATRALSKGTP